MDGSARTKASAKTTSQRGSRDADAAFPIYEHLLDRDPRWAMSEGSLFFEGKGAVQEALCRIARRLSELGIPYAVSGGMALFEHGFRRFTDGIEILVTADGLKQIHAKLDGLGYLPPFTRSKNLRDTDLGVRIEFLVAGQFPGDGRPKPVAFPDPDAVSVEDDEGIRYLALSSLIELKLASGMTQPERMKDLTDVLELIKLLNLPKDFAENLDPFVREKFIELWSTTRQVKRRYVTIWRNKFLTIDATSLSDMIESLRAATATLESMRADGITLDPDGDTGDDYAYLVTTDPEIARKYDMHNESEFLDGENPEE